MAQLDRLQRWHRAHCDGAWEHQHRVRLETSPAGGWTLHVDLTGTPLAERPFPEVREQADDPEYALHCRVGPQGFDGACGPWRLADLLARFLDWAEHGEDLLA